MTIYFHCQLNSTQLNSPLFTLPHKIIPLLYYNRRYQFMPFRDRAGRRILCIFPGAELREIPPETHVSKQQYK